MFVSHSVFKNNNIHFHSTPLTNPLLLYGVGDDITRLYFIERKMFVKLSTFILGILSLKIFYILYSSKINNKKIDNKKTTLKKYMYTLYCCNILTLIENMYDFYFDGRFLWKLAEAACCLITGKVLGL